MTDDLTQERLERIADYTFEVMDDSDEVRELVAGYQEYLLWRELGESPESVLKELTSLRKEVLHFPCGQPGCNRCD